MKMTRVASVLGYMASEGDMFFLLFYYYYDNEYFKIDLQ